MPDPSVDELRRSLAQWEQFADLVSHDLRAPLRAVDNLAQWIQEGLGPDAGSEVRENLALLRQRVKRMAALLDDLREYSRVEKDAAKNGEVDLGELAREAAASLPARPGIEVRIASRLPRFMGAPLALRKALLCLLSNAVKHHDKDHGLVELDATDLGANVEIVVSDDGPGIEAKQRERVFLPCQTLKRKDEVEGSGMGLAILKRLADVHGGSVRLESEPGRGSRFYLTWPAGR